ncbi:hypothetical protein NGF19_26405, partial [Streptomyces sp. RY43-2]|nr:hypothetical protein [Streptomyces macrolidinus]
MSATVRDTPSAVPGEEVPWEEVMTVALLGTDRRTPPWLPPGRQAPGALLDLAAVATVRRRAGLRPAPAGARPEPSAKDTRPPPP